ncbi:MAG: glycosyltransferase family 4 protein [Methanoregula sp.]|nr:glycosyltransferase family 4 protein [Methanoregula sp.]
MPEQDRMKIAFVYDAVYPYVKGGVEKRVWELAVILAARGHAVHIFGMKYWEGDDILIREGVVLHGVCPAHPLYLKGKRTVGEALSFAFHLIPALMKDRFDLIDCQQFPYFPCISAKLVSLLKGTPLVITWHEVWGDYWYAYLAGAGMFGKSVERLVSRLTPHGIAVSRTTAWQLEKIRPPLKATVIKNGVDLREIAAISPAPHRSDILFAGRLIGEKHADLLIDSLYLLLKEDPKLTLLIVGEGPEEEALRIRIREKGMEGPVRIRHFFYCHEDLVAEMKAAKVFVLPSTREGFGIAALEALACGLPVVTVDHPANAVRELITERTGFLCTLTAEDLADALREALRRHAEMRDNCIAAAAGYSWESIAVDLERYYRSVTATDRARQE